MIARYSHLNQTGIPFFGEQEQANLVVQLAAILKIYIGVAHTVIPIQRQHAHKIEISRQIMKEDASRFGKRGRGDTIIQMPRARGAT